MNNRWRTIDIVIASIIAVAFGVIFWAWGLLWNGPADAIPLPGRAILYGVWLVPAVLGALVIRKPGAALYTLTLAALVSVALGTSWGWTLVLQGPIEAAAAELVFAAFAYRRSEEHTSELQSQIHLVCRLLLVKKNMFRLTGRCGL